MAAETQRKSNSREKRSAEDLMIFSAYRRLCVERFYSFKEVKQESEYNLIHHILPYFYMKISKSRTIDVRDLKILIWVYLFDSVCMGLTMHQVMPK